MLLARCRSTWAMERELKRKKESSMTLIYRGQKYVQNKAAAKKQPNEVTYRGKPYTRKAQYNKKRLLKAVFFFVIN